MSDAKDPNRPVLTPRFWKITVAAWAIVIAIVGISMIVGNINSPNAGSVGESADAITVPQVCLDSMRVAANVDALNNDAELVDTLSSCSTADDWVQALKTFPGAGSLTSYSTADAESLLGMACAKAAGAPVCVDASASGRI